MRKKKYPPDLAADCVERAARLRVERGLTSNRGPRRERGSLDIELSPLAFVLGEVVERSDPSCPE